MRISREQAFMETAHVWAKRATCFRLNVGAVVVVANRVVSLGYNGAPPGKPHCSGNSCPGKFECRETVHAERNALLYVPDSLAQSVKQLYVTHSPCQSCAELIAQSNVNKVYFTTPYRNPESMDWLSRQIEVKQMTPAGYIIDWRTKEIHAP